MLQTLTGYSENKSMTIENEGRPGVAKDPQDLSSGEATILVLIEQGGQIWQPYSLAVYRKKLTSVMTTPG